MAPFLQHHLSERLLLLALVLTVSACGFQLRGSLDISKDLSPILIEKNSVFELSREIKALLGANDIKTVDSEDSAQAMGTGTVNTRLSLIRESKSRRVLSVDGNGRAKEYLLKYTVNYSIKIKQSKQITETISVQRSLLFDPDAVLAVVNETEVLYKDMRRDVARLILLKLQAHSRNYAGSSVEDSKK
ncbi:MAG: hypothetical protein IMF17_01940 [Proteobacteria bacterium]|nr:hypothetical protein [Pseudomonadota bacterium]